MHQKQAGNPENIILSIFQVMKSIQYQLVISSPDSVNS